MTPRTKTMLLIGGAAAVGIFGLGWYLTSGTQTQSSSAPQNAVNPNAQDAPGGPFGAQGTMPDIGNLLSYNQVPGSTILTPQATSVTTGAAGDWSATGGSTGWTGLANGIFTIPGSSRGGGVDVSNLPMFPQQYLN